MAGDISSKSDLDFSIVIPLLNEEGNLPILYSRLTKVLQQLGKPYEIIFVDDGSADGSFKVLKDICGNDDCIRVIRLTRNFGQHQATMAGFNISRGKTLFTLDADLQNPPEEIPKFIEKLDDGYDVVFGMFEQRKHSAYRRASSWFAKRILSKILSLEVINWSGFKAMRSYVFEQINTVNMKSRLLGLLLCWAGYKVGTVEVKHDERYTGKTKYSFIKLFVLWFDMVASFTDLPLKIATFGGLLLGTVGLALSLLYLIGYFLYGYSISGFATTAILITFFSGIQLFAIGILGEYVGRISKEVKNRPEYIIREIIDKS